MLNFDMEITWATIPNTLQPQLKCRKNSKDSRYMKYNNKTKIIFSQLWQIYLPCLLSFMFEANMKERWIFKRSLSTFPHNYFYFRSLLDEKSPPGHGVISTICAFIHTRVWTLRTEHAAVSILIKARPQSSKSSQCCYTCFVLLWQ